MSHLEIKEIEKRIIVAMDVSSHREAEVLANKLDPKLCRVKVGKELFTAAGPLIVKHLKNLGFDVFLDLKYHDIPNTVARAVKAATDLGVWMVNVHALGGGKIMEAAAKALDSFPSKDRPLITAVTILTSMGKYDLNQVGIRYTNEVGIPNLTLRVVELARLAKESGLDGVICSGQEAVAIRQNVGNNFTLVTPGIRLSDASQDDQARVMTPEMAIENGADYLVVGRPITKSDDPLSALRNFQCVVTMQ